MRAMALACGILAIVLGVGLTWWFSGVEGLVWVAAAAASLSLGWLGWHVLAPRLAARACSAQKTLQRQVREQWRRMRRAGLLHKNRPWYVLIGPRGSGKTSLLERSGLPFLATPEQGTQAGHAAALGCDFWVAQDATYIDTPGAFCEAGEPRALWGTLLRELRRKRGSEALQGVVVTMDVAALADPEQAFESLRQPLQDLVTTLRSRPPVYLVLTQCDHIEGFAPTFADLAHEAAGQVWGFALSGADSSPAQVVAACGTEFARLVAALRVHTIRKMDVRANHTARLPLFFFPQAFARAETGLCTLVARVFAQVTLAPMAALRGVYFCAAPAPASASPRAWPPALMGGFAAGLIPAEEAAEPAACAPQTAVSKASMPQAFFCRDLLARLLPAQRHLVQALDTGGWRGTWRCFRAPILCGGVALLLLALHGAAASRNAAFIAATRDALQQVHRPQAHHDPLAALAPLRERLEALHAHHVAGAPLGMRWGMYQGAILLDPLSSYFAQAFATNVLDDLHAHDRVQLDQLWRDYAQRDEAPPAEVRVAALERLKMHLLLAGGGRAPAEGQARDDAWLVGRVIDRHSEAQGMVVDHARALLLGDHVRTYLRMVRHGTADVRACDQVLVSRVRAVLGRAPIEETLVAQVVADVGERESDLTLTQIVGGALTPLRAEASVPAAFTRPGWESHVRPWLQTLSQTDDAWVLGLPTDAKAARERANRVRSHYYASYIGAWRQFIDGVSVAPATGQSQHLAAITQLTRGEPPPLRKLLQAIADHTRLAPRPSPLEAAEEGLMGRVRRRVAHKVESRTGIPAGAIATAPAALRDARDVEDAFAALVGFGVPPVGAAASGAALPLDVYQEQLVDLRNAWRASALEGGTSDGLLEQVASMRATVQSLLEPLPPGSGTRPRLQALLLGPLGHAAQEVSQGLRKAQGAQWCTAVYDRFKPLRHLYPFAADGADAALADVADYYRPDTGALWGFYRSVLQEDVRQQGGQFVFDPRLGGAMRQAYVNGLTGYLRQAYAVTRALFGGDHQALGVAFDVRALPAAGMQQVALDFDGEHGEFDPTDGHRWQRMTWPGAKNGEGALLRASGVDGAQETFRREGPWALLRLLEAGTVRLHGTGGSFTVHWPLATQGGSVALEIRPARRESLFFGAPQANSNKLMQVFRQTPTTPPATIARGGVACP